MTHDKKLECDFHASLSMTKREFLDNRMRLYSTYFVSCLGLIINLM